LAASGQRTPRQPDGDHCPASAPRLAAGHRRRPPVPGRDRNVWLQNVDWAAPTRPKVCPDRRLRPRWAAPWLIEWRVSAYRSRAAPPEADEHRDFAGQHANIDRLRTEAPS